MINANDYAVTANKSGKNYLSSDQNNQYGEENDLSSTLKKEGQALKNKAGDLKDKASNKLDDALDDAKDKASEAQATISNYVKENPLKALGWAVLGGALAGILLRK